MASRRTDLVLSATRGHRIKRNGGFFRAADAWAGRGGSRIEAATWRAYASQATAMSCGASLPRCRWCAKTGLDVVTQ
jgi:hypothetical protein